MAIKPKNDFDTNKLVETSGKHNEEISDLKKRVRVIEDKFGDNEKIANTIYLTADSQVKMQEMLELSFVKQLQNSPKIKEVIDTLINESDRKAASVIIKKVGIGIWTIIVAVISGAVVYLVK